MTSRFSYTESQEYTRALALANTIYNQYGYDQGMIIADKALSGSESKKAIFLWSNVRCMLYDRYRKEI